MLSRLLTAVLTALLLSTGARAATVETEIVKGAFVAEHETVAPGEATAIALDMTMEPGWHTYWKNAGDSGQPVEVIWTAPAGVKIGPIEWPAPGRQPFPPMMNYGYSDAATLLMPVQVPSGWPTGEPIKLKAEVYWLVCNQVCIPEQGETTFQLDTGPETATDPGATALFTKARAAVAQPSPYEARHQIDESFVRLRLESPAFAAAEIEDAYFFPREWGVIDHAAMQVASIDGRGLTLAIPRSPETDEMPAGPLSGVLEITETSPEGPLTVALAVDAKRGVVAEGAAAYRGAAGSAITLPVALVFAFIGGLILNLMPCVFPVLALKALGFTKTAREPRAARVAHGAAYTAGVLVLFVLLAAGFLVLRSAGMAIGWGFQLQNPFIVVALAYLLLMVGLNLSGVFEVTPQIANTGAESADRGGIRGAFFTGALAAVVATPCTAPFMATAMGATLTMSAPATLAVFMVLGLGLAAPFLLLSLLPGAGRWMPKPGVWMLRLKEFLAFPMYASAAWLVWVLGALAGPDAVLAALIGGVALGIAAWAYGAGQCSGRRGQILGYGTAIVAVAAALALATQMRIAPPGATASTAVAQGPGEPFSTARLAGLRAEGAPVFVNMTADWCITCKVNERIALGEAFETALAKNGVTYLKGDWTARDPEITALLEQFDRAGVPLYAVFPREGEPELLPQILTTDMVVDALGRV